MAQWVSLYEPVLDNSNQDTVIICKVESTLFETSPVPALFDVVLLFNDGRDPNVPPIATGVSLGAGGSALVWILDRHITGHVGKEVICLLYSRNCMIYQRVIYY